LRRIVLVSVDGDFVNCFGFSFAHGLPIEIEAVCVVNDPIQDGVCKGWLSYAGIWVMA